MYESYEHRERRRVRYLWLGHLVEEVLHERLSGPAEAVASDRGQTSDMHNRLVVDETSELQEGPEPHATRTVADEMNVSLLSKCGRYEVQPASGNRYEVDIVDESCICSDMQQRSAEGGPKHPRRADHEIKR